MYIYLYTDMISMPSKTIMIDSEVYEELKRLKQSKSFTEIIRELLEQQRRIPKASSGTLASTARQDRLNWKKIKQQRMEKDVSL